MKQEYPECVEAAQMRYLHSYFFVYDKMIISHEPDAEKYRKILMRHAKEILHNPYIYRTRKLGFLVLCVSRRLYRKATVWYENKVDERELS